MVNFIQSWLQKKHLYNILEIAVSRRLTAAVHNESVNQNPHYCLKSGFIAKSWWLKAGVQLITLVLLGNADYYEIGGTGKFRFLCDHPRRVDFS